MGTGKFSTAPIDETIGLLNKINISALTKIQQRYPEFQSILETGVIAGVSSMSTDELNVRAEVCKITLEETLKKSKEIYLPLIRSKLKKLQRIEL
jgi:hypothetical protein